MAENPFKDVEENPILPAGLVAWLPNAEFFWGQKIKETEPIILPIIYGNPNSPRCECGSTIAGSDRHSTWCPLHTA